jgi:hypothetical protein
MGRTIKKLKQTGKTIDLKQDKERQALLPGKRVTIKGTIYWETRSNRSDRTPRKKI